MIIPSYVYFARAPATGLIKIGFSHDVAMRLTMLVPKADGPPELLVKVKGYRRHEGRVHAALIEHHVGREWFEPAEKVLVLAGALKHGFMSLDALPDLTSPILSERARKGHADRRARLRDAA